MENTKHHWETKMGNGEIEKGFRAFHTVNIGSVGQRASKSLAVKFGVLNKKSATQLGFEFAWGGIILNV